MNKVTHKEVCKYTVLFDHLFNPIQKIRLTLLLYCDREAVKEDFVSSNVI